MQTEWHTFRFQQNTLDTNEHFLKFWFSVQEKQVFIPRTLVMRKRNRWYFRSSIRTGNSHRAYSNGIDMGRWSCRV